MPVLKVNKGSLVELPGNRGESIIISVLDCGEEGGFAWVNISIVHPRRQSMSVDSLVLSEECDERLIGYGTYLAVQTPRDQERSAGLVPLRFSGGKAEGVRFFEPHQTGQPSDESRNRRRSSKKQSDQQPVRRHREKRPRLESTEDKPGMRSKWAQQMREEDESE